MEAAIRARLRPTATEHTPYLYRYLVDGLPDDDRAARGVDAVLRLEQESGAVLPGFLIGRRFGAKECFI